MPTSVLGTSGETGYVELGVLKSYLSQQYRRRYNGPAIASHKFFGRRFGQGKSGGLTVVGANGQSTVLVPLNEIEDYLSSQYDGMGGSEIAAHGKFLNSIPVVYIETP